MDDELDAASYTPSLGHDDSKQFPPYSPTLDEALRDRKPDPDPEDGETPQPVRERRITIQQD